MCKLLPAACVGFVSCICGLAQSSPTGSAQLILAVYSEAALSWQGNDAVLVKVRLAPGMRVTVWSDDACGAPPASGQLIPASGAFPIQLGSIGGPEKGNVCLSSNDASVRAFLPIRPK
jgi:hypothetical protein